MSIDRDGQENLGRAEKAVISAVVSAKRHGPENLQTAETEVMLGGWHGVKKLKAA